MGFLHDLKVAHDNKVELHIIMDLLARTVITPPKIILNSEYLPCNLNFTVLQLVAVLKLKYINWMEIY